MDATPPTAILPYDVLVQVLQFVGNDYPTLCRYSLSSRLLRSMASKSLYQNVAYHLTYEHAIEGRPIVRWSFDIDSIILRKFSSGHLTEDASVRRACTQCALCATA